MSDSNQRAKEVMKSVEKCLLDELRRGADGLDGKNQFKIELPNYSIVTTLEFIPKLSTNEAVIAPEREKWIASGSVNTADQADGQSQCDNPVEKTEVVTIRSRSLTVKCLSGCVTEETLKEFIATEIQPDGFSVALKTVNYADAKYAYVNLASSDAASEAKQKLDEKIAEHIKRGDKSIFTTRTAVEFQHLKPVCARHLHDHTTEALLHAEGLKLDGFVRSELFTFPDGSHYGLLHFCDSEIAETAVSRLIELKAQYRADGDESIFVESTTFQLGIPKVKNSHGLCQVDVTNLQETATQTQLDAIVDRMSTYGCTNATLFERYAIFDFLSSDDASWGYQALIDLKVDLMCNDSKRTLVM